MTKNIPATVLSDFHRAVRDEPLYYIYRHQIWVEKDEVSADEVIAWLRKRYVDSKSGNRYRLVTYAHQNGLRYVDSILMETLKDTDLIFMKLKWGWTDRKVKRGNRVARRRLTKPQKIQLDAMIKKVKDEFYDSI